MKYNIPALALLIALSGCGAGDYENGALAAEQSNNSPVSLGSDNGDALLLDGDVKGAAEAYQQQLADFPADGRAAAGAAVTGALLIPYSDASTALFTGHLGGSAALDAQGDVLYGDQGLLYFISRGVPWEDGEFTAGIKTLLAEKLPWSVEQLDSLEGFVSGLDQPVALLTEDLTALADELGVLEGHISIALADPEFRSFNLPGEVFHDSSLDATIRRSELAAIGAAIGLARAGLYFFCSYEHGWTLERAFGTAVWEEVAANPEDPDFVEGFVVADYQLAHLNASAGRMLADASQLGRAREALRSGLDLLVVSIESGIDAEVEGTLVWRDVNESSARDLVALIEAVSDGLEGPSEIPFTEPALTIDLSPLFVDGRTVPSESDLFRLDTYENEFGATVREIVVDETTMELMLEGLFTPEYGSDPGTELLIAEDIGELVEMVTGDVATDVERTVAGSF